MKTVTYTLKLGFLWDDGPDVGEYEIKVPENVSDQEVCEKLIDAHNYLDSDKAADFYGVNGRIPSVLLDYVCEQNGWEWSYIDYDIDIELD